MTRDEIRARIAELDKMVNAEMAGARLPPATPRRQFPKFLWTVAAMALAWMYLGNQIPGAQDIHTSYSEYGLYTGAAFGAFALWGTFLFLIQPSVKISPEYQKSTERVRALQEERRELMAQLRALEQD